MGKTVASEQISLIGVVAGIPDLRGGGSVSTLTTKGAPHG